MKDFLDKIDWTITKSFGAYRHVACKVCVMSRLLQTGRYQYLKDENDSFSRVRKFWVGCLTGLHLNGWHRTPTWKSLVYLSNCPPFGVRTDTQTRRCNAANICPFCFARMRVLAPFRRFETVIYGISGPYMVGQRLWEEERNIPVTLHGPALKPIRRDLKIIWFRRRVEGAKPDTEFTLETLHVHIQHMLDYVSKSRREEVDGFGAEHGCVNITMCPSPSRGVVSLVRSGVLLVPDDTPLKFIDKYLTKSLEKRSTVTVEADLLHANKKGLFNAFTKAIRYPRNLMFCAPKWAALTLNLLKGTRLFACYGKVHSKIMFDKPNKKRRHDDV